MVESDTIATREEAPRVDGWSEPGCGLGSSLTSADDELELLLDFLRDSRGVDFTGYKRASLSRRILRRMRAVGIDSYAAYTVYLELHTDELSRLFNTVLINVTSFFRDASAWGSVDKHLRAIVASRGADAPIRVWSAGCASGEEAYSIAMLLAEIIGPDELARRVKIFATDIDEDALVQARAGTYAARSVEGMPPALLAKYFTKSGSSFVLAKELRRCVIFGRHDLVRDAPISRLDLLSCRNTLMYFNARTQARILERLRFALTEEGTLLLGRAEMLVSHTTLFTAVDLKARLFKKTRKARA